MRFIKNTFLCSIMFFSVLSTTQVFASDNTSVGFIQNPIWFSKDYIVSGDGVKIYTLIYNGSSDQLKGMVVFYNGKVVLGRREIIVPGKSVKDVSIDWKPVSGTYKVRALLENPRLIDLRGVELKTVDISEETKENVVEVKEKELVKAEQNIKDSGTENISKQFSDLGTSLATDIPKTASNIFTKIDRARSDSADFLEKQKDIAEQEKNKPVVKSDSVESKKPSFIPDNPFAIAKYYLYTVALFVFNIKVIFFSLLILILYFLIRFVYRKIKNR